MIRTTDDGSQTLIHPIIGDSYHSLHGAVAESEHIYISAGLGSVSGGDISILEVGFGSGLNALLTIRAIEHTGQSVRYTGVELYPVWQDVAQRMDYAAEPHFLELHSSPWGEWCDITPSFKLLKERVDLVEYDFNDSFDLVYFDAFAPDSQPELWSEAIFARIYSAMNRGGVLVTYSSKGVVKRALRAVGFEVSRLAGPVGKRHIVRAVKK
ncbi:MAG: tRNA (5-methylaminomethyl-2-thiouridine)(34)-methyltransferase MnmD [Rikenellaceae bacterium]